MMNEFINALEKADEDFLISISNKGVYKRACKDNDGITPDFILEDSSAKVNVGGETCTVSVPLSDSKCSCVSRGICRHIISAIMILRDNIPHEESEDIVKETNDSEADKSAEAEKVQPSVPQIPDEAPETTVISDKETAKINDCANHCLSLLGDIIRHGLVRVPEKLPESIEASAVRCHSLRMADAERAVREIGGRLSDCIERRASFSMSIFVRKICDTSAMLLSLTADHIEPPQLGVFRQVYESYKGNLTIIPIGQRSMKGGEYEGEIYYFLNEDENAEQRFLSFSDLRPVFYNVNARRFSANSAPWDLPKSLKAMSRLTFTLQNAKLSDGKISSSKETHAVKSEKANLNCHALRSLIYTDFRRLAVDISCKDPRNELDKLVFVQPVRCVENMFDKYLQQHIITIEDSFQNIISVRARYSSESKQFIELLDGIGQKMLDKPQKNYVILAIAYIENGELTLFPIEIYDFINHVSPEEYELPEEFRNTEIQSFYAKTILSFFDAVSDKLQIIVRCGLQSDILNDHKLENTAFNYGLKTLSTLLGEFMQSASSYRHSVDSDCIQILDKLREIYEYISKGRKHLEIITSLNSMKKM